jgi:NitT/TauT family transport system permease protein
MADKSLLSIWVIRATLAVVFIAFWELCARTGYADPVFFGSPSGIYHFLVQGLFIERDLYWQAYWTIGGTLIAFVLGSAAAIVAGLLFVIYPMAEKVLEPAFAGLNALPRIALAPLFLLWFGLGLASKIALGVSLTFFIVLASTTAGIRSVSADHLTLAKTLGATPAQIFRCITLPGAIPTIFAGLRLGLIYALLGVVGGEIIAAQHGLGQLLAYLAGVFQTDGVFAVLLLLAVLGTALTQLTEKLERVLLRWQ